MGKNGGVNFNDWEKLKVDLEAMNEQSDLIMEACAKELAARLLAKVVKRTPVGVYGNHKKGGTLRRGWTAGKGVTEYAQSLKVHHFGDNHVIVVSNPTEYASYVEYGHRTRNHAGWVEGKFMLTISERELESMAPAILEKKIIALLKKGFE